MKSSIIVGATSSYVVMLIVCIVCVASYCEARDDAGGAKSAARRLFRRDAAEKSIHGHLSRKVLERACAAGKDAIDEIMACFSNNAAAKAMLKPELALKCHRETFNMEFDMADMEKHRKLICDNRDKFELMTACVYREATANVDVKQREIFIESMVDLGLCIINALN